MGAIFPKEGFTKLPGAELGQVWVEIVKIAANPWPDVGRPGRPGHRSAPPGPALAACKDGGNAVASPPHCVSFNWVMLVAMVRKAVEIVAASASK
jgi:hypothetical protein